MMEKYISPEVHSRFLQTCDIPAEEFTIKPFTMVIFGGAGDLSQRKLLPALYHLYHEKKLPDAFSILGFGLPSMSDEEYRKLAKDAFAQFSQERLDESAWGEFCRHLFYLSSDFTDDAKYQVLCNRIHEITTPTEDNTKEVIYYLAAPPAAGSIIIGKLAHYNLCRETFTTRIIMEKPFGRDRASATSSIILLPKPLMKSRFFALIIIWPRIRFRISFSFVFPTVFLSRSGTGGILIMFKFL